MAKFYAVYKGKSGSPKILNSWDECKAKVICTIQIKSNQRRNH